MPNSLKSLLPCPFCGGEASISSTMDESIWSHNIVPWTSVACTLCDVQIPPICEGSENDPITAWNTRAPIAEGGGEHIETLRAIGSVFAGIPSPCAEREALDAAIESLSRQGGEAVAELIHSADALTRMVVLPEGMQLGYGTHKLYASPTRASESGDWVFVPRVPTKEMCRAGLAERHDDLAKSIYAAMIAAAPAPGGGKNG